MNVDERRTLRIGGVFGLVGNLVMLASLPLAPKWPPIAASTAEVVRYFVDNRDAFLRQAWVAALGVILLVAFAAALHVLATSRGAPVAGTTMLGAMLVFVGAFACNWTPWIAIAMRPERSADAVQALYDFGLIGQFIGVGASLALLFGALAALAFSRVIPRGFAIPAIIAVVLNIALAGASQMDGALSPSGPIGMASMMLFGTTLIALSIWMLVAARR